MLVFAYQTRTNSGVVTIGTVIAKSREEAIDAIKTADNHIISITQIAVI